MPGADYQATGPGGFGVRGAAFIGNLTTSDRACDGKIAFNPGAANDQAVTIQLRPK